MTTRMLKTPPVGTKVYVIERGHRRTVGYDAEVTKVSPSGQFTTTIKFSTPDNTDPRADRVHRWYEPRWGTQWRLVGTGDSSWRHDDWTVITNAEQIPFEKAKVQRERNTQRAIATLRNASENIKVQASTPTFHNRVPNDAEMVEIEAAYAKLGEAIELSKAERALQAAERAEAQAKVKQESE